MRTWRQSFYLLLGLIVVGGPAGAATSGSASPFVTFQDFVARVSAADAARYVGAPGNGVESTVEFEKMRSHLLSLYEGVQPTHSFLLYSQYVDCIPILQQPSARALGLAAVPAPPPMFRAAPASSPPEDRTPLELGLVDEFGHPISCESGTIPMRRITLEELARFATLSTFFQKRPIGGNAAAPGSSNLPPQITATYHYEVGLQTVDNGGAQTLLNIWYPTLDPSIPSHSISQLWVEGSNPPDPLQTAEVGWRVSPYFQTTSAAVLFIFWTPDGYAAGGKGCYNLDCPGFVQTNNNIVLGMPNWPGPSQPGGQQVNRYVGYLKWQNNWYLYYNCSFPYLQCIVGQYPTSIYSGGQMSRNGTIVAFGGEVASAGAFPPMGSGVFASGGSGYAANQSNMQYWDPTGSHLNSNLNLGGSFSNGACYTFQCVNTSCNNVFYFGGPGGSSCPGNP